MKVAILTNTYRPHVGGVANSVQRLETGIRQAGHEVCIVAPTFPGTSADEPGVIRLPALENVSGGGFSVSLPAPGVLHDRLEEFGPDLLHAQHPFLLGDTALRWAEQYGLPLLYTYHTMYELYTHYTPADSPTIKRFVIELCKGYCDLCDHVVAPSKSIKDLLQDRGVSTPVTVIPTGVDCEELSNGDGGAARASLGLSDEAFVIGHVGRLAPEKNLGFLAEAVGRFLARRPEAAFVVVGEGVSQQEMTKRLEGWNVLAQSRFTGVLTGSDLADHYSAMNVFAFSSKSETQGMVLTEAMASGVPVVALDANGVRDTISDGKDGVLVFEDTPEAFAQALASIADLVDADRRRFRECALEKARKFNPSVSQERILDLYERLIQDGRGDFQSGESTWDHLRGRLQAEWEVWSNRISAATEALASSLELDTDR